MNFKQLYAILKSRRLYFFVVSGVVAALALAVSLLLPKQYTAEGAVVIDTKSPDPLNGIVFNGLPGAYIATQADIIKSDRVARKVISSLGLDRNEAMRVQWQETTDGQGVYEAWLAALLAKNLDVKPSRDSSVLTIAYTAVDPTFAAVMTNAFMQSYVETSLELRVEPAKQYRVLFDQQAKQARENLEKAQTALSTYQKEHNIIATDERIDVESARLAELSSQLVMLQALSAESGSRKAQVGSSSTEVLNSPLVSGLKADLSRQEAQLKEASAKFGAAHPNVLQLQANIAELKKEIAAEVDRVIYSVGSNNTVNRSREGQIKASLDAQRQKLLQLKEQRDGAAVLTRDVENYQRAYELLQARVNQVSLESQNSQTNVSVLQVATPPAKHSFPRMTLMTVGGAFLGVLLGVLVSIMVESNDRRIRIDSEVVDVLGTHLLGHIPNATDIKKASRGAPLSSSSPMVTSTPLGLLSSAKG